MRVDNRKAPFREYWYRGPERDLAPGFFSMGAKVGKIKLYIIFGKGQGRRNFISTFLPFFFLRLGFFLSPYAGVLPKTMSYSPIQCECEYIFFTFFPIKLWVKQIYLEIRPTSVPISAADGKILNFEISTILKQLFSISVEALAHAGPTLRLQPCPLGTCPTPRTLDSRYPSALFYFTRPMSVYASNQNLTRPIKT